MKISDYVKSTAMFKKDSIGQIVDTREQTYNKEWIIEGRFGDGERYWFEKNELIVVPIEEAMLWKLEN